MRCSSSISTMTFRSKCRLGSLSQMTRRYSKGPFRLFPRAEEPRSMMPSPRGLNHLQLGHLDKKALIIVSDGGDNASRHNYSQVLRDGPANQSSHLCHRLDGSLRRRGSECPSAALQRHWRNRLFPSSQENVTDISKADCPRSPGTIHAWVLPRQNKHHPSVSKDRSEGRRAGPGQDSGPNSARVFRGGRRSHHRHRTTGMPHHEVPILSRDEETSENCETDRFVLRITFFWRVVSLGLAYAPATSSSMRMPFRRLNNRDSKMLPNVSPSDESRYVVQGGVMGEMEVPRLGLKAMFVEGDSARILRRAVGHISETALPGGWGNVVLTGHRDSFFRPLRNIRQGDVITLKTPDGNFQYQVESTAVVLPKRHSSPAIIERANSDTGHLLPVLLRRLGAQSLHRSRSSSRSFVEVIQSAARQKVAEGCVPNRAGTPSV